MVFRVLGHDAPNLPTTTAVIAVIAVTTRVTIQDQFVLLTEKRLRHSASESYEIHLGLSLSITCLPACSPTFDYLRASQSS